MKKRIVVFFLCCVIIVQNISVSYASGLVIPAVEAIGAEEGLAILLSCLGFSLGDDFASRDAAREKYMEAMSKADFTIVEGGGGNDQKPTNQFKEFCSNVAKGVGGTVTIGKELWQATLDFAQDNVNISDVESDDSAKKIAEGLYYGYHDEFMNMLSDFYKDTWQESMSHAAKNNIHIIAVGLDIYGRQIIFCDTVENAKNYELNYEYLTGGKLRYVLTNLNTHTFNYYSYGNGQYFSGIKENLNCRQPYMTIIDKNIVVNPDIPNLSIDDEEKTLLYPSEELKKYFDKFGTGAIKNQDVINNNYYVTNGGLKNATRTIEVPANYQELLDNFKNGVLTYPDLMNKYNATAVMKVNDTNGDGRVDSNDEVGSDAKKMRPDFDKPLNGVDNDSKKMVYDLSKFFPFCIPFDFVDLIKAFSAPPQTPKFHYCIKIEKFNVDWNVDLDLTDFNTLAYWCRVFETIIFIFILMKLTSKLIKW